MVSLAPGVLINASFESVSTGLPGTRQSEWRQKLVTLSGVTKNIILQALRLATSPPDLEVKTRTEYLTE